MANFLLRILTLVSISLTGAALAQTPRAVATVGMIANVAAEISAECVDVTAIMGPGTDPHLYQAKASDVRSMQQSDLIMYSGYQLEGQLGDVLDRLGARRAVLAVAESAIPSERLIETGDAYGVDPHVWMDVSLWADTTAPIAEALAEIAPACAGAIRDRAAAYHQRLLALHGWVTDSVTSIPERQRLLVTAHDAFAYFGRAYGIDVAGIQGVSTEAEPSIADIRATVDLVIDRNIPAVFIESTINPRTVRAVIEAAVQRGHAIELGPELYSDAMGESGAPSGTYIGMIVHNTRAIVGALGGAPAPFPPQLVDWADRWGIDQP